MVSHRFASIRKHFLSGLIMILPLAITFLVFRFIINMLAGIFTPVLAKVAPDLPIWVKYGLAVSVLFCLICLLGLFASNLLGRWLWARFESLLLHIPLMNTIYSAARDIIRVFHNPEQTHAREVVLVDFPHPDMKALGFATGKLYGQNGRLYHKVFIPTAPNPTTGFLELVEDAKVTRTDLSVEEFIKMLMSGGILGPQTLETLARANKPQGHTPDNGQPEPSGQTTPDHQI